MGRICIIASDFREDYNDDFVIGAEIQANKLGFDTEIFSMPQLSELFTNGEEKIYQLIDYSRYDGIIFVERSFSRHKEVGKKIAADLEKNSSIPLVSIGSTRNSTLDTAIFDDCSAMLESLTDHLIEVHNCKRIFFLGGEKDARNGKRIEGFCSSMNKHGFDRYHDDILYGGYWIECAEKLAKNIAFGYSDKPDAVVCINDTIAFALIKSLYRYGLRVPEDIIVTGFDGAACSSNSVIPITTIEADSEFVGKHAAAILYEKITGKASPEIKPKLRTLNLGLSCGCGQKKPANIRLRLDILEKRDKEAMEFRNSHIEERMYVAGSIQKLAAEIKDMSYLIPDCRCLGVSLINPIGEAECIHLSQTIEGDAATIYTPSSIFPDGKAPFHINNVHILPLIFSGKMLGFMTIGYDEAQVYGHQAKEFNKIVSTALEFTRRLSNSNKASNPLDNISLSKESNEASPDEVSIIMAEKDGFTCKVAIDNIIYIEAGDRRVYITTKNNRYEAKRKMFELEQQLEDRSFMRISKSCIANLKKITSYRQEEDRTITAITSTKESLRVSRGNVETFRQKMT